MVENRVIPHLEALMSGYLESEGRWRGSPFTSCHALVKVGILLDKKAKPISLYVWNLATKKMNHEVDKPSFELIFRSRRSVCQYVET